MTRGKQRTLRRLTRAAATAGGALLAALALTGTASAAGEWGIEPGSFSVSAYRLVANGSGGEDMVPVTQAGAHPQFLSVQFALRSTPNPDPSPTAGPLPNGSLKDVHVTLPAGLTGDPEATPRCSMAQFDGGRCSPLTMVGYHTMTFSPRAGFMSIPFSSPVYNITPEKGRVAQFAFKVATVTVVLGMRIRSDGRYDLATDISDISQALVFHGSRLVLFGVPADMQGPGSRGGLVPPVPWGGSSGAPRKALLTLGSTCDPQPPATISVSSWQHPDQSAGDSHTLPQNTGCDAQQFEAGIDLRPDRPRAAAPAGYEVKLTVPQAVEGSALATPPLKRAEVTLPQGVVVSPSSVTGLKGCTDEQAALSSEADPTCPDAARIGSVQIDTPVLSEPLTGGVYLGQPKSFDASTGEMLRLFLIAEAQGVTIKQEGRIVPDPVTGQLKATFDGTPQLPFSKLAIRFNGGERAPLTNPQNCGTYTTTAKLTGWNGETASTASSFDVTEGPLGRPCAALGFAPTFQAGMGNAAAGASSTFTLSFGRDDAQQDLGGVSVDLPAGLMGMIGSADLCPDAQAAAGTCGEGSRIGSVRVTAGPGANPFPLAGRGVYVTGPYKGAPFGMSIVVPAVAGPFDLGTVVVRAAIHVDRKTAALRVVSDPMPTILQGIPLRLRTVTVAIDKPGFMVNPTSCTARQVAATVSSAQGASAAASSRFQVGGCTALPYKPTLGLRIGARGRTRAGVTTPFTATLRMTPGQANNRAVTVKLPRTLNARLRVISDACTIEQFEADQCTRRVGSATAVTPVLRDPLVGDAYFVRNPARRIPDLMVALKGQGDGAGVRIDLTGKVTIPKDLSLKTAFDTIPDVPISSFRLSLVAGANGAIGAVSNLCTAATRRASVADVGFRAHSGRGRQVRTRLSIAGCARASSARKR